MIDAVGGRAESVPTRVSLLGRLRDWNDQESWQEFYNLYCVMIGREARRHGLSEAEAEDVVQETMVRVARSMPHFKYRQNGSFRGWLIRLTRWRVQDVLRRRATVRDRSCGAEEAGNVEPEAVSESAVGEEEWPTNLQGMDVDELADERSDEAEEASERDWRELLLREALNRVKRRVDAKNIQIFDLHVMKGWPAKRVAHDLRVSRARVYLVKKRISRMLKGEVDELRRRFDQNDAPARTGDAHFRRH